MLSKEEAISNGKDELMDEYPFLTNEEAEGFMQDLYEFLEGYFFRE